jgi:hypothetical protein
MTVTIERTYRVRLTRPSSGDDWGDLVTEAFARAEPYTLLVQIGTVRKGWPWARYDAPQWRRVCTMETLEHVEFAIRDDMEAHVAADRSHRLWEAIKADFKPITVSASVVLGDSPDQDAYTITPNA